MTAPAVIDNGGWDLTSIGLKLRDPELPFERFEELCWMLGKIRNAVQYAIGDAIIQGEAMYGHRCYQAFEEFGISEEGLREYARVAGRVPHSNRKLAPSWSHARAVATFLRTDEDGQLVPDYKRQKEWLKRASDEQLSHHALRDALRDGGAAPSPGPAVCRCCHRPL